MDRRVNGLIRDHDLRPVDENGAPLYAPGSEPLCSYSADVLQIYFSV